MVLALVFSSRKIHTLILREEGYKLLQLMAFLISESKPQVSGEFTHKDSETKFSRTSLGRVFIHDTSSKYSTF